MCINSVQKVYKIGRDHWRSIVASVDGGLMSSHGNTGKPTRIPKDDPGMPSLRAYFEELISLHKYDVRASLAVREMTRDGNLYVRLKEDEKDVVWLSPSAGIRSLYYRYALLQG